MGGRLVIVFGLTHQRVNDINSNIISEACCILVQFAIGLDPLESKGFGNVVLDDTDS